MKNGHKSEDHSCGPTVIGTGLIALDLIVRGATESPTRYFAGGTCGNVLAILGFLGWDAYPFARLNGDFTSKWVRNDLKRFGVHTDYLSLEPTGPVPVIIEWITKDKQGNPRHKFSFACPTCGSRKPAYKPVPAAAVKRTLGKIVAPNVFFFDRVSRAALILAKEFHDNGSLIVFEPSGIGDPKLFLQALELIHVLKYANDRMGDSIRGFKRNDALLEIETLGKEGIRFRSSLLESKSRRWKSITSFTVPCLKDSAGSGDWFTASLISQIGGNGFRGLMETAETSLVNSLRFAQASAAWNCAFEAPRGGMYTYSRDQFLAQVRAIEAGQPFTIDRKSRDLAAEVKTSPNGACLHCQSDRRAHARQVTRIVRQAHAGN